MSSYKAENAGRMLGKVNPRGTTEEYKHGMLDRDYNASLNIRERGLEGWTTLRACGDEAPSLKQEAYAKREVVHISIRK